MLMEWGAVKLGKGNKDAKGDMTAELGQESVKESGTMGNSTCTVERSVNGKHDNKEKF